MTLEESLVTLESMGTAQNRKTYIRHGACANLYGVSSADMGTLKKKIKTDHGLARGLWASGNYDARILATMVADPSKATSSELDEWVSQVDCHPIAGAFSRFAATTPLARKKMELWMKSKLEHTAEAGWTVFSLLAGSGDSLTDKYVLERLAYVEAHIHTAQNRVRHAMNSAVIATGGRSPKMRELALAAAARIGKVAVNHGDTDCKTPDAAAYIHKVAARAK